MKQKVIIIGAGIAGPAIAIQLKRGGYEVEIYEARKADTANEGVFLGVTPNGLNVLAAFISIDELKQDFTQGSMFFYNSKRKQIGSLTTDYQKEKYGNETIQVKRRQLYRLLHETLYKEGISILFDKRAIGIAETTSSVKVNFSDGTSTEGDMLFGCDGVFSMVRKCMFPDANSPAFTKNISTGGFCFLPELSKPTHGINMTFGERGFFAYAVSNHGEIWWFNNYFREKEPSQEEIKTTLNAEIVEYLLHLHKNDDPLFSSIIKATKNVLAYPVYDIPKLDKWHTTRTCLMGDAAHATSPHVGQGASLALEDTLCLFQCLRGCNSSEAAFEKYQKLRQPRVEKIIKQARKIGDAKSKPNPIAVWFRDRMLKHFINAQIKKLDWIYGYRGCQ